MPFFALSPSHAQTLVQTPEFCSLYPIAIRQSAVENLNPGEQTTLQSTRNGPGNYSWLTWTGDNSAPQIAESLTPPGDSDTYINPSDPNDNKLDIGDWVQGSPGVSNAAFIRAALDNLINEPIFVPIWDDTTGTGANFNYHVSQFAIIRLQSYRLNGRGYLTFIFERYSSCYNHRPIAENANPETPEDTAVVFELPATDGDGDALEYTIITSPVSGSMVADGANISYTPNANFNGNDSLSFSVFDGEQHSDIGNVNITVTPVNDQPLADAITVSGDEDTEMPLTFSGSDIENSPLSFTPTTLPQHGQVTETDDGWVYTPDPNFNGNDQLTYVANDGELDSEPALCLLSVNPVNDPPTVQDLTAEVIAGESVPITLLGDDIDGEPELSYRIVLEPGSGTTIINEDTLVYSSDITFEGTVILHYVANDGIIDSDPGTVSINVISINEPPTITSSPIQQGIEESSYLYDVEATDPNNDTLSFYLDPFDNGGANIDTATGEISLANLNLFTEGVREQNLFCGITPSQSGDAFSMRLKWEWEDFNTDGGVAGPVMVAQLTDDNNDGSINVNDIPDLVFHTRLEDSVTAMLIAISGDDGTTLWRYIGFFPWDPGFVSGNSSPGVADIDNDGIVEIVSVSNDRSQLFAFEHTGQVKWAVSLGGPTVTGPRDAVSFADVDNDGSTEIIHGRRIFNGEGQLLASGSFEHGGETNWGITSFAANIDLTGNMEIIAGRTAYDTNGNVVWRNTSLPLQGYNAIGNFDDDDYPEIVFVGGERVYLLDHQGNTIWGPRSIPGGGFGGPPTVADFDGDNKPEIAVAGENNLVVFETDGTEKWRSPTVDSSARTSATAFDFQGDGKVEIVYADEQNFMIFEAATGSIIHEIPHESGTQLEYPIVADIDSDGHAELVVASNYNPDFPILDQVGVLAFEAENDDWATTRPIWNQHPYHITHINDDGSVPEFPESSWLTQNTFRTNSFINPSDFLQVDLSIFDLAYNDTSQTISATIKNRGLSPSLSTSLVEFYSGEPDSGTWLGDVSLPPLDTNAEQTVTLSGISVEQLGNITSVTVNTQDNECLVDNNSQSATTITVFVEDEGGLSDSQTYLLSSKNVNDAPELNAPLESTINTSENFSLQVSVTDDDRGDAHRFSMIGAPEGITIDTVSGLLKASAGVLNTGTYSFTISVEDLAGAADEMTHTLHVTN